MIKYHADLVQGSDEWLQMRCGMLTASEMKLIVTPGKLQYAANEKCRAHLYELAAQRISGYVEPCYIGDDMLRGQFDEIEARKIYSKLFGKTTQCGFITNDKFGFNIGYSPDWLIGIDGQAECKSRKQKYQVETIVTGTVPAEHVIQLQTGLMVSEREWVDYVSYCAGMPMFKLRVHHDKVMQDAIANAATAFHEQMSEVISKFSAEVVLNGYPETVRTKFDEITEGINSAGEQWNKGTPGNKEKFMCGTVAHGKAGSLADFDAPREV